MDSLLAILIIIGLAVFESVSSIDNAIINAEVLSKTSEKAKRWFLTWGLFIGVFCIRGLLPFALVWGTNPEFDFITLLKVTFSDSHQVQEAIAISSSKLLIGGGVFLILLFLHWLFLEEKNIGFFVEPFFKKIGIWFFAAASLFLTLLTWYALQEDPFLAFSAILGSTAFFIVHGFRQQAAEAETALAAQRRSDISKLLYLECVDASFSIDGVLGAFAFTFSIPLILIGNGLGAWMVRYFTLRGLNSIKQWRYLKNGAMYSIGALGILMIIHSFKVHLPEWLSPLLTLLIISYFFFKSLPKKVKEGK